MGARRGTSWVGFLEAGSKGSPVVRDAGLETGSPRTIYLFNYKKGRILEYRRDIVEPLLRELRDEEKNLVRPLRKAFEDARAGFTPRAARRPKAEPRQRKKADDESVFLDVDVDMDDAEFPILDSEEDEPPPDEDLD